jgi:hypothetical protein
METEEEELKEYLKEEWQVCKKIENFLYNLIEGVFAPEFESLNIAIITDKGNEYELEIELGEYSTGTLYRKIRERIGKGEKIIFMHSFTCEGEIIYAKDFNNPYVLNYAGVVVKLQGKYLFLDDLKKVRI